MIEQKDHGVVSEWQEIAVDEDLVIEATIVELCSPYTCHLAYGTTAQANSERVQQKTQPASKKNVGFGGYRSSLFISEARSFELFEKPTDKEWKNGEPRAWKRRCPTKCRDRIC